MCVCPDALLIAIDIEALYSSIPHKQGIGVVKAFLQEQDPTTWPFNVFILTHNHFTFLRNHYLHVQGVTMGTSCASANLFSGGEGGRGGVLHLFR